ncbi:hypothetical protein L3Y19_gp084 [Gordonia phage Neville]|uniref:Uncharacterized protein n=2 Tax=Nevillevirus TaxID=3044773 RepID=A0A515MHD9_9CAUD|nr:hypothetical protein L3Y19_gp084 [Gordonia phage Neville]YP_010246072.1 hypothetical protein L3Y20_gp087 [Gordonia phage Trax]AXQ64453.1 hypothetical protein SEA_NEVILLE_84 [Gordonia phage Neville]QDM55974.1 hypothetical protein SEA_TRAX_87 [Gordonia phage Trax]
MAIDYTKPTAGRDSMAGKLLAQKQGRTTGLRDSVSWGAERELLMQVGEQLKAIHGAVDGPKPVQKISYKKVRKPDVSSAPRFKALKPCPRCGAWRVHRLAEPNPDPPNVVDNGEILCSADDINAEVYLGWATSTTEIVGYGNLQPTRTIKNGPRLDRFDERGFEVIRICPECAHTWGEI